MKVLHVITGLGAGGAERQLQLLVRHLDADCEIAVLTNPGTVAAAIRAEGVPVHDLGMRGNRDLAVLPRLVRLIREIGPDVVHTHLFRAGLYGRLAARLAPRGRASGTLAPVIVATEHSVGETQIEGRRLSAAVRSLYLGAERLGDLTIAVSPTVAGRLTALGVRADRITMIPNGLDARAFRFDPQVRAQVRAGLGIPPDRFVVGGVGRLEPGKRFDVLIDALARPAVSGAHAPASRLEQTVLLLVGTGGALADLRELAERRGVADRVVFTGERSDVAALMSAMDMLAAPSEEETFGLSVLEGLASGLPVRYVSCPALDDLPAGVAPDARRIPPDPAVLRSELAVLARRSGTTPAGRGRWAGGRAGGTGGADPACWVDADRAGPVPAAVGHYDIAQVATQTKELYERLLAARHGPAVTGRHVQGKERNE